MSKLIHNNIVRFISITLSFLLCLPAPDVLAAVSKQSVFSNKQVDYEAIRRKNLERLEQKRRLHEGRTDEGQPGKTKLQATVPRRSAPLTLEALHDLSAIHIPSELGQILDVWEPEQVTSDKLQGTSGGEHPTVIILQDLHAQYDAQLTEGKILEHLYNTYNVRHVASEGASTPLQVQAFQDFPRSKSARRTLAEAFLRVGELTGHEYQAIVERLPLDMRGVDDQQLYDANREVFVRMLDQQESALASLEAIGGALQALEPALVHQPLRDLLLDQGLFEISGLDLGEFTERLLKRARSAGVDAETIAGNIARFVQLNQRELLLPPRERIEAEQRSLMEAVRGLLQADTQARRRFADITEQLQHKQISAAYAMEEIVELAQQAGVSMADYPAAQAFHDYLQLSRGIRTHELYAEIDALTGAVGERLVQTDDERLWWRFHRGHRLLKDAV